MANNPIDTNSFQHFLLIRGAEYEIIEPVNFDKSNFKCEQGNYARDTFYGNEEELLEFYQDYGSQSITFMNNDGVLISHLASGLDLLLQENKDNGSESDVKYILKKDGLEFTTGNFDFTTAETDNESYFKCKVIQNTNQSKIKKREKLNINLLSTNDLDDNVIDAIPVQKMLLKAKSIYAESKWKQNETITGNFIGFGQDAYGVRLVNVLEEFGIKNSFVAFERAYYLQPLFSASEFEAELTNSQIIRALEDLSNIKIKIKNVNISCTTSGVDVSSGLAVRYGTSVVAGTYTTVTLDSNNTVFLDIVNKDYEIEIPFLPSGGFITIDLIMFQTFSLPGATPVSNTAFSVSVDSVEISASSTAIDSVINAVRWIDLIKQNYKAIGSLPVNASKFDVDGEFYDNFCFTKNLIKQDLTKPFNIKLSDTIGSLEELNADAQINDNEIYIGQYGDFYNNIDMGGFLSKADFESNFIKNERYLVNDYVFGYEKFEQDRDEKNTIDAIHTNSEWFPQVQNSINTKEFKAPFIRDAFSIETARKSVFSTNNNSDSTDDNIFITDVIQLAPNSRRKFTRLVRWQADGGAGTTKILSDGTFSWDLLGFNVGDTIIESGVSRTVLAITPNLLTLSFVGGFAGGVNFLSFDYPLTNVLYTNRTNEGLIFSDNLRNADNFSNLRYSIKRNMRHWFPNLATYGKFIPLKKLKNTFFKANGLATTQFIDEPEPITENADIPIQDISEFKILNQDIFKTRVSSTFEQSLQLLNDVQNVRGFIRVQSPDGSVVKGYIKESNFIWSLDELDLELEVKNESDFLTVTYSGGILTINEVGYTETMADIKLYNIFNHYIQFFDKNNVNLCNRVKFDKVLLNGVSYSSVTDLVNAIELL